MEPTSEGPQTNQNTFMSQSIDKLATALNKVQKDMEPAKKDTAGYNYKYADLATVMQTAKKPLTDNGFSVSQLLEPDPVNARVTTLLLHTSGQWLKSTVAIKPVKADPQGMGSAITYARRYGYSAILGMATEEDDDGNKASGQGQTSTQAKSEPMINDFQIKKISALGDVVVEAYLRDLGVEKLEDLTLAQASKIIGEIGKEKE